MTLLLRFGTPVHDQLLQRDRLVVGAQNDGIKPVTPRYLLIEGTQFFVGRGGGSCGRDVVKDAWRGLAGIEPGKNGVSELHAWLADHESRERLRPGLRDHENIFVVQ